MNKSTIGLLVGVILSLVLLISILVPTSSSGVTYTSGVYVFGEEIEMGSYMYNLTGPGEIIITSTEGEETYYRNLKEGEALHEHYISLQKGYTIEVTEGATLELV